MSAVPISEAGLTVEEVVLELVASLKSDREEVREQLLKNECRFCCEPFAELLEADASLAPAMCEHCTDDMKRFDICGSDKCASKAIKYHKKKDHEWLPVVLFNKKDSEIGDFGAAGAITKSMVSAKAIALTLGSRVMVDIKLVKGLMLGSMKGDLINPHLLQLLVLSSARGGLKLASRWGKYLGFGGSGAMARMGLSSAGGGLAFFGCIHTLVIDSYDFAKTRDLQTFAKRCGRNVVGGLGVCMGSSYGMVFGKTLGLLIGGPVGMAVGAAIGGAVGGCIGHSVTCNAFDLLFGEDEARKEERQEAWEKLISKKEKEKYAEMIAKALSHFSFSAEQINNARVFNKKELKKRYFQRAKECHPDMTGDDGARFIDLSTKYGLLLGIIEQGVSEVIVDLVGKAQIKQAIMSPE
jgi:hypothetical protein